MSTNLRELMQSNRYLDPITNEWTDWPGRMEADHFVPVRYIKTMPGFQKLDSRWQGIILRYEGNIQPLPRHHNRYKSDHMPSEWWFTLGSDGEFHPVNADYLAEAAKWEQVIIEEIQNLIDSSLAQLNQEQRDKRWPYSPP
ncbi:hypothetical protein [Arthrobacter sp. ISL-72]|uniref:hypothetical protein n=1 Tax=Arthrobacter sp. ISL-72 TaxID=2819114 RepID=UPI001BEBEA13|nr:hypothetical protein [Arthrobacter sp. ISL-72]MBT2597212.1 hypothetical protein [Arthrobacter sp. ISL-72]